MDDSAWILHGHFNPGKGYMETIEGYFATFGKRHTVKNAEMMIGVVMTA